MKNHFLILVTKMCEAGCKVLFSRDESVIIHKGTVITKGHKNKCNALWYIPIHQSDQDTPYVINDDNSEQRAPYNNTHQNHPLHPPMSILTNSEHTLQSTRQ